MPKKQTNKSRKKIPLFLLAGIITAAVFSLAAFFDFKNTVAATEGWAVGIWNDTTGYVTNALGIAEEQKSGIPTTGWLASRGGLTTCYKPGGVFYGITLAGSDIDNSRTLQGASWFGIGSAPDSGGACQNDGDSLGWLDFNKGFPDFCAGLAKNDDCYPAEWQKKAGGTGFEGTITGWAQVTSMKNMPKPDGTTAQNGWVRIYGAKVDANGKITNENNYAWNSGEETTIPGNSGLGWIKLDGLKVNNCSGHPGCMTVSKCRGWKVTASTSVSEICTSDSTGFRIIDDTHWKCRNECQETPETCSATINDSQDGACGSANGGNFCGKDDPADLCNPGAVLNYHKNYSDFTWSCGDPNGCGGKTVSCSAIGNNCGWIETNPSN